MAEKKITRHNVSVRHGDSVKIISGRDKGKTGRVLSINAWKNTVTVEHANIIKRHTRPNPNKNVKGGIVDKEGAIHMSNVMLICPGCGKPTRAGHTVLSDGSRKRSCRHCKATFEN